MANFSVVTPLLVLLTNSIGVVKKEGEIGRGCGTCGRIRQMHTVFCGETGKNHFEDLFIDWRIILKWI